MSAGGGGYFQSGRFLFKKKNHFRLFSDIFCNCDVGRSTRSSFFFLHSHSSRPALRNRGQGEAIGPRGLRKSMQPESNMDAQRRCCFAPRAASWHSKTLRTAPPEEAQSANEARTALFQGRQDPTNGVVSGKNDHERNSSELMAKRTLMTASRISSWTAP